MSPISKFEGTPVVIRIAIFALSVVLMAVPFPGGSYIPLWSQVVADAVLFLFVFWLVPGLLVLYPPYQAVLLRWGRFVEVIRSEGVHFRNPWGLRILAVKTAQQSMDLPPTSAVDSGGTKVQMRAVVTYHVADAKKAALDVQDVAAFVQDQAAAVLRCTAGVFPYESPQPCLREPSIQVTCTLVRELGAVVAPAGVEIDSVVWSCHKVDSGQPIGA